VTDLTDRVAVITGASYGIGRAISIGLAGKGCRTILVARSIENLTKTKELIDERDGCAACFAADIGVAGDVESLKEYLMANFHGVDFLINNASAWISGPLLKSGDRALEELFRTTVYGTALVTKKLLPLMIEKGGNIIFIGSTAGTMHRYSLHTAYVAAKSAVAGFSRCLRNEVSSFNVRVTTIHLGQVYESYPYDSEEIDAKSAENRLSVHDIVDAVVFVVSRRESASVDEIVMTPAKKEY